MARVSPFSARVLRKALPALILALLIFVSLMFVMRYTDAFFLVILIWIVAPVALVKAWRRLRAMSSRPPGSGL